MKSEFLELLACPNCSSTKLDYNEHVKQTICSHCSKEYECRNGVFIFTKQSTSSQRISDSFSKEWKDMGDNVNIWGWSPKERADIFLNETGLDKKEIKNKMILDAGCGVAQLETELSKYNCDIVGIDVSNSIFTARKMNKGENTLFVQADILELPFKDESFDIIYSDGVLHHNPNTKEAFVRLLKKLRLGGKITVWLYKKNNYFKVIDTLRIVTKRMPRGLLYNICYYAITPIVFTVHKLETALKIRDIKEEYKELFLSLYDALSPSWAHRHTEQEVVKWFEESGLKSIKVTNIRPNGFGVRGIK